MTDSQAVGISDFLLDEQETKDFLSEVSEVESEKGPAWEHSVFHNKKAYEYPNDLQTYGPEAYGAFWEQWLEELAAPTPHNYYQINAASVIEAYDNKWG